MSDLYPTKTRLALLRDIADGQVLVDRYGQAAYADQTGNPGGGRITARWAEFCRAGWAVRPAGGDPRWKVAVLTEAGRAVLEEHR